MIYLFIKMSGKWYGQEIDDVESAEENIQAHVDNGNIVVLADDIETFAEEMGIEVSDIEMVDGE